MIVEMSAKPLVLIPLSFIRLTRMADLGGAYNLSKMNIHPAVTKDHVPIVRLAVLQFHKLHTEASVHPGMTSMINKN